MNTCRNCKKIIMYAVNGYCEECITPARAELGIESYTIFTNKYCTISLARDGYIIHSLSGKYSDKQCETLTSVSLQTQIPLSTLKAAQKSADLSLPL